MVHVGSLIALIVFYVVILIVGIAAAWKKTRQKSTQDASETLIVAHRDIGVFVGLYTMTAVWVGGGYITGTAEAVFTGGLLMAQAPIGYALSLIVGGLFFSKPMRDNRYVTMLDPFQKKYGQRIGALMYIPAFIGEIFWSAAILASLGASISVIIELDFKIAVLVSGAVAVLYTFFGGQYSVCYTDVAQLILITFGLLLCTPFAWHSSYVSWNKTGDNNGSSLSLDNRLRSIDKNISVLAISYRNDTDNTNNNATIDWIGKVQYDQTARYIDEYLLIIFGGIPWQDYFQRVLSAKSTRNAQILSAIAGVLCFVFAIPPVLIGFVALYADWDEAGYSRTDLNANTQLVLPLVLQYLTPKAAAFFGLGAVAAGVMSSTDASVLSSSSMFTHNIYRGIFRPKASDREMVWVLRFGFAVAGALASVLAILDQSVYSLWVFCSDFVYVILFPQLVCVLFCPFVNSYGLLSGCTISILLRILGGENSLYIPPVLKFPYFDYVENKQRFPFKTFCMLINFVVTFTVSFIASLLIKHDQRLDILEITNRETTGQQQQNVKLRNKISATKLGVDNDGYSECKL